MVEPVVFPWVFPRESPAAPGCVPGKIIWQKFPWGVLSSLWLSEPPLAPLLL